MTAAEPILDRNATLIFERFCRHPWETNLAVMLADYLEENSKENMAKALRRWIADRPYLATLQKASRNKRRREINAHAREIKLVIMMAAMEPQINLLEDPYYNSSCQSVPST